MSDDDLNQRFLARLEEKGLTDRMKLRLLLAPPEFNFFGMIVREIDTFGLSVADMVQEEADSAGRS